MPGDLNLKKSWNPALMKNQKKVWEREQQALKELQTIKQREKEIAQEREKEEMLRLQYGSDPSSIPAKDKLELNKLGWMYNDGPKNTDEDESGFREVEEDFLAKSDEIQSLLRGNKVVQASAGSRFDKVISVGAQASASTLNDDPLLMMKRASLKKRREERDRSPGSSRRESSTARSTSRGHRYTGERDSSSQGRTNYRDRHDRDTKDTQRRRDLDHDTRDTQRWRDSDYDRSRFGQQDSDSSRSRGYGYSNYDSRPNRTTSHRSDYARNSNRYTDRRYPEQNPSRERSRQPDYRDRY